MSEQYQRIEGKEIEAAAEHDPQRALLMILANAALGDAEKKAAGREPHEPKFRKSGWSIAIETPQGIVGLWSCWLDNQFYLGYPKYGVQIRDQLIMDLLGVELARPVINVNFGVRQWARFYGPKLPDNKGRVWIDHNEEDSYGCHFEVITKSSELQEIYYGHSQSRGIRTVQFSFFSDKEPESPNATPEAIQPYREKFLALACEIARQMGGVNAVNIDYSFVLVPEQLPQLGYSNIVWLNGEAGVRQGWGNEVVRAEKATANGKEIVVLKSGNSIVPWSTIRRVPGAPDLSAEKLIQLLTF